jgi:hypothetical protein
VWNSSENNDYESVDDWSDDNEDDNESNAQNSIEFPELEQKMRQILSRFGSVFPKLNWSSCQDSQWINASGTRCTQSSDIYLLLKSSDNIVHDLTEPWDRTKQILIHFLLLYRFLNTLVSNFVMISMKSTFQTLNTNLFLGNGLI